MHAETERAAKGDAGGASVARSRRVAVDRFKGTGDVKSARAAVVSALEAEVTIDVASIRLLEKHKELNDGSPEGYSTLAEKLDLLVILYGKVGKGEQGFLLALTVVNGKNGKSLGTLAFHGETFDRLLKNVQRDLLSEIEPILDRAGAAEPESESEPEPAPPPEPKPESEKEKEQKSVPEPKPEPAPAKAACPWLEVELGGGVAQRQFNWVGELSGPLRGYRLKHAPFTSARGTYRPLAHRACSKASGLGVRLGYEHTLGIDSAVGGQQLDSLAFAFESQVEFKYPIGPLSFTPRTGFVYRHFELASNLVPDPSYKLVALGLDGGVRVAWFLVELGWSARFVVDAGSLQSPDWFPNARGFGYLAEGRIGAAPTRWLDAFALVEYESYAFDLNARVAGPAGLATGSYDRYLRVGVGVRFNIPSRTVAR